VTVDAGQHGFCRVAAAMPVVHLADPVLNLATTADLVERAESEGAAVVAFPELGISGYSIEDLVQQRALLDATRAAIEELADRSRAWRPLVVVGAPLAVDGRLHNCAVVLHRGEVLGVVPKSYLPNYREFYEKRQYSAAREAVRDVAVIGGAPVPFGADLLFECTDLEGLVVHVEICEDVWVPIPPSTFGALAGATVLVNLSASNITIGKAGYRHELASSQSARTIAAYLYTSAGAGESTTDLAWDGHGLVYENGRLLAESRRFDDTEQLVVADVDLERLLDDRMRMTSYGDSIADHRGSLAFRRVAFELGAPDAGAAAPELRREVERFPFVPASPEGRDARCEEAFRIQTQGLVTRMRATGLERLVIGVSGGLDSTHALLVACRAVDDLDLPRTDVLAYTMPGFATSSGTRTNAWRLMESLGVTAAEIDIRPSATQMLTDLGHPAARGEAVHDVTYENVQAGERTSHLFRLANMHGGLVVGTGDLSELALGWCTYGVGDQMSHYNVNASVPKTLMQFLIRWVGASGELGAAVSDVLADVVETEISPELVPADDGEEIGQRTEDLIGPYDLHDFFLYYTARYGFRPSKVAFLAHQAWHDAGAGTWPDLVPEHRRRSYTYDEIVSWLRVFLQRFFATSQFKRSAMPNGPKIGSGGSLSPRGDWRAPSDASAAAWLAELDRAHPPA
jgi:NAD+ synthase (glutamine-hydrolysing)